MSKASNPLPVLRNALAPILAAAMAILTSQCGTGCSDQSSYTEAQKACVLLAKTREESCLCRRQVDWDYGLCGAQPPIGPNCVKDCAGDGGL